MAKCFICKQKFTPIRSSLEKTCQEIDCRTKWAMQVVEKQKQKQAKEKKESWTKEKLEMRNEVTNWKQELQTEINKIVRLIDKDLLCLARNKGGQIHAGHIFSRGSNPTIKYNLHNIHRQNAQSNHFQNDDGLLREGLVKEYGQSYMDFISELRKTPSLPYNNNDYNEFTLKARKIVLRLKKLDLVYSLKNRILIRNKINCELGIYQEEFCIFDIVES